MDKMPVPSAKINIAPLINSVPNYLTTGEVSSRHSSPRQLVERMTHILSVMLSSTTYLSELRSQQNIPGVKNTDENPLHHLAGSDPEK